MYRATTPRHIFNLHTDIDNIKELIISYEQNGKKVLEKGLDDVSSDEFGKVYVTLTQEETKLFEADDEPVLIQVRLLTNGGVAMASKIKKIPVNRVINDEVME